MCCGCDTSYIVSFHIQCQASIYTLLMCRRHSWRVRLAKQETRTPPGHLVSPLVCRGPWMSTVVLYCWCHSDSASVLLYFTWYTKRKLRSTKLKSKCCRDGGSNRANRCRGWYTSRTSHVHRDPPFYLEANWQLHYEMENKRSGILTVNGFISETQRF